MRIIVQQAEMEIEFRDSPYQTEPVRINGVVQMQPAVIQLPTLQ